MQDTYSYVAIWLVQDKYPNAAIWLVADIRHSVCTLTYQKALKKTVHLNTCGPTTSLDKCNNSGLKVHFTHSCAYLHVPVFSLSYAAQSTHKI